MLKDSVISIDKIIVIVLVTVVSCISVYPQDKTQRLDLESQLEMVQEINNLRTSNDLLKQKINILENNIKSYNTLVKTYDEQIVTLMEIVKKKDVLLSLDTEQQKLASIKIDMLKSDILALEKELKKRKGKSFFDLKTVAILVAGIFIGGKM